MKIVQSFFTDSLINGNSSDISSIKTLTGITDKEKNTFYWYVWLTSVMSFVEKGYEVELVADENGKRILVDLLGFPYKNVVIETNLPKSKYLWALGKLKAYSIQNEPFLHFDGDAFYRKQLPEVVSPLFVQDIIEEKATFTDEYYVTTKDIIKNFHNVPTQIIKIAEDYDKKDYIEKVNVGVIGGKDVELLKTYSKTMLNFVEENLQNIDYFLKNKSPRYITIFMSCLEESSLLQFYKEKYGDLRSIQTAIGYIDIRDLQEQKTFMESRSRETGYTHYMGNGKSNNTEKMIEHRQKLINDARKKYPEYCELFDYHLNK